MIEPVWRPLSAIQALENLVDAAEREGARPPAPREITLG